MAIDGLKQQITTFPLTTTIPCPYSTAEHHCCGCLNGTAEDGVIVFRCNECGEEAGRG